MERTNFEQELKRLQSQWPNSYGEERKALLWQAFKGVSNFDFRDAVSDCLGHMRAAPLVPELEKAVTLASRRAFLQNQIEQTGGAYSALELLAQENHTADKDFVQANLKHLRRYLDKEISKKEFETGCDALDELANQLNPTGRVRKIG